MRQARQEGDPRRKGKGEGAAKQSDQRGRVRTEQRRSRSENRVNEKGTEKIKENRGDERGLRGAKRSEGPKVANENRDTCPRSLPAAVGRRDQMGKGSSAAKQRTEPGQGKEQRGQSDQREPREPREPRERSGQRGKGEGEGATRTNSKENKAGRTKRTRALFSPSRAWSPR